MGLKLTKQNGHIKSSFSVTELKVVAKSDGLALIQIMKKAIKQKLARLE